MFRKLGVMAVLAALSVGSQAAPTTISFTDFNAFTNGSVNGQGGWGVSNASFDQEVVDLGGGNKVLRLSNKVTSGSFGDQPFAPRPGGIPTNTVTDPDNSQPNSFAGESSTGAAYNKFIGSFDFRSVSTVQDPGARITISPDNGSGGRQGFIALTSAAAGVGIETFDVDSGGNFVGPVSLGTVNHAAWHNLRYEIEFNDGPNNDVATIFLDNVLVSTVASWENFYVASQPALHPLGVPVQTFLFRLSGTAAPNAQGFYIDNVRTQLDNTAEVPEPGVLALLGLGVAGLSLVRRRKS